MKELIITAFICMITAATYGQDNSIRWQDNQLLQWDDFAGQASDTSKFDAQSFAEICYHYTFYSPRDFHFDVFANFRKNTSWIKKQKKSEALLRHEQLHFNIAALYAEKLKDEFSNFHYTSHYEGQIANIFRQKEREYQAVQRQYDEETNHSLNKERQRQWEDFINNELRNTRRRYQLADNVKRPTKGV